MHIRTYFNFVYEFTLHNKVSFKTCNGFITAKFEEWRRQLGSYIIDYNSVILEEAIAKGLRMKMAI